MRKDKLSLNVVKILLISCTIQCGLNKYVYNAPVYMADKCYQICGSCSVSKLPKYTANSIMLVLLVFLS